MRMVRAVGTVAVLAVDSLRASWQRQKRRWIAATAIAAATVSLWFVFLHFDLQSPVSQLERALQRADGSTLLSMCYPRERELLGISPDQVNSLLKELYGLLGVQQIRVRVIGRIIKRLRNDRAGAEILVTDSRGETIVLVKELSKDATNTWRIDSLSEIFYVLARKTALVHYPQLKGEATPEKRKALQQVIRQFLEARGVHGVFQVDLRPYPEIAWRIMKDPERGYELIDYNKHTTLLWPDE